MKRFLDCLGEACPAPLVKVQKELDGMASGDALTVNVDYGCAVSGVPGWAREQGHRVDVEETGEGEWDITITKA